MVSNSSLSGVLLFSGLFYLLLAPAPGVAQAWMEKQVPAPTPASIAAVPVEQVASYGAALPFLDHEAENARTNGVIIGPDRRFTSLPAEASGRRAVRLDEADHYVEFVLSKPANALTIRYALPDSTDGGGLDASLIVNAGDVQLGTMALTSRYSWYYGDYPFTNDPTDGIPHHFYDEARLLFRETLPAGSVIRLSPGPEMPDWLVVDLAGFEQVEAPGPALENAISVLSYGADPTGEASSARAFDAAIAAGRTLDRPVYIPSGTYRIDRHIMVDDVTLVGAGHWHSVLTGDGVGVYGHKAPSGSRNVVLRDFAIIGEVDERVDSAPLAGIGGAMSDSLIENIFIQHTKVGLWFTGPMENLTVRRVRVVDQAADGLNFHGGVTNSVVEDSFVRNSGDDGLAMWSHHIANSDNTFRNNTVIAPGLANGIAIYGGEDITVSGNLVADIVTEGGGLHLGQRFDATPFGGKIEVTDNMVLRGGVMDPNWHIGVGAFWVYALDQPISDARIVIRGLELVDSTYEAIHFIGKTIMGVALEDIDIDGAGTHALQLQADGQASVKDMIATELGSSPIHDCDSGFAIIDKGGNAGLDGTACHEGYGDF